jgi:hypothetical protein
MHPKLKTSYRSFLKDAVDKLALTSPSFDIEGLCNGIGVKIRKTHGKDYKNASLVLTASGYEIRLPCTNKDSKFSSIQRFLLAHELGHLLLEREFSATPASESDYWQFEELCDYFARALLLPEAYIKTKIDKSAANLRDRLGLTNFIARNDSVPWPAVAHRVREFDNQFAFFRVEIRPSIFDKPKLFIDVSTLEDKALQHCEFSDDNELGRLVYQMGKKSFLSIQRAVFEHPSVMKKFPSLSSAKQGGAYKPSQTEVRLIVQLK